MTSDEVIEGLLQYARPIILAVADPHSCCVMTRIAIEVLDHFGFPGGRPANVDVLVLNRVYFDLLEAKRVSLEAALPEWALEAGAWGVLIGEPKPTEIGHVVCRYEEDLIDLSLDMASRPAKGIELCPLAFVVGSRETQSHWVGDTYVEYRMRPDLERWRLSNDWRWFRRRWAKEAGEIIRKIQEGNR